MGKPYLHSSLSLDIVVVFVCPINIMWVFSGPLVENFTLYFQVIRCRLTPWDTTSWQRWSAYTVKPVSLGLKVDTKGDLQCLCDKCGSMTLQAKMNTF